MTELLKYDANDFDAMWRTMLGEAEHDDVEDATAIAWVIRNRVEYRNWPDTVAAVCYQPWQFSCWNADNPNLEYISTVKPAEDAWIATLQRIANGVLECDTPDITKKSTHYYATYAREPKWAKGHDQVFESGWGRYTHFFFNNIDTPPPTTAKEALDQIRPLSTVGTMKGASGAAATVVVGGAVEAVKDLMTQAEPYTGIAQTLANVAPYALAAVALGFIGYVVWRRMEDRKAGLR